MRYGFQHVISVLVESSADAVRRLLPRGVEPVEPHHGTGLIAIDVYDFGETLLGPYRQVMMSVVVAPIILEGTEFPKAAFYPFQVASDSVAAQAHITSDWGLPHWPGVAKIDVHVEDRQIRGHISIDGKMVIETVVTQHTWNPAVHHYQCRIQNDQSAFSVPVTMEGSESDHEDGTGRIRLASHPFNDGLDIDEIYEAPVREVWMRDGAQTAQAPIILSR